VEPGGPEIGRLVCSRSVSESPGRVISSRSRPSFPAIAAPLGRLFSFLLVFGALACGRPATQDECRVILRRAAELQLEEQFAASREVVQAELDAIEASMKDAMMQKCVGKRITDGALSCVKRAKTSKELLDVCLD
jgi:hypothetical protein